MRQWIFLLKLCRPQLGMMLLGFALSFIALMANISLLALSGWFLAAMAAAGLQGVHINYFTPAGVIRFLAIVRTAASYAQRLVNHNATFLLLKTLRVTLFSALEHTPNKQRSGDLLARFQDDIEQLDKFYLNVLLPILLALTSVPIVLLVLGQYSALLAVICLVGLVLVGVALPFWVSRKLASFGVMQRQQSAALRNHLVDGISGLKELTMTGATAQFYQQLQQHQQVYQGTLSKGDHQYALNAGISSFISQFTLLASFVVLITLISAGQITALELAMLTLLILGSFETVLPLPDAMLSLSNTQAAAKRIMALLPSELLPSEPLPNPSDKSPVAAHATPADTRSVNALSTTPNALKCTQLSFSYDAATPCLTALNLSIKQGEKVAIVGASGAGKTTLLHLLAGQLKANQGTITVFEQPIESVSSAQLHATTGVLSQHHYLFSGTVKDNLQLSEPNASEEQMLNALKAAQLSQELAANELSLHTFIGNQGKGLSVGQARRIAIAQLLLRQSPIILLDEPTAGLDNHTQQQVFNALLRLFAKRTVLMISHEPRLLTTMDKVIWLENGAIKGCATHHQLRQQSEDYCNLTTVI